VPLGSQYVPPEAPQRLRERAQGRHADPEPPPLQLTAE
jgi:hypothetical protein